MKNYYEKLKNLSRNKMFLPSLLIGLGVLAIIMALAVPGTPVEITLTLDEILLSNYHFFDYVSIDKLKLDCGSAQGHIGFIVNNRPNENYGCSIYFSYYQGATLIGSCTIDTTCSIHELEIIASNSPDAVHINSNRIEKASVGLFDGDDSFSCVSAETVVYAGHGDDTCYGGSNKDELHGGYGSDILKGKGGDDYLYGDGNNDKIFGGLGNDVIDGGPGRDRCEGEDGNDDISGGDGNDNNPGLFGGQGDDTINGGDKNDYIDGGLGNDTIYAGPGKDHVIGGPLFPGSNPDNDVIYCGSGDDGWGGVGWIHGGGGDDIIYGEGGKDKLKAGFGQDTLDGGPESDSGAYDPNIDTAVSIEYPYFSYE